MSKKTDLIRKILANNSNGVSSKCVGKPDGIYQSPYLFRGNYDICYGGKKYEIKAGVDVSALPLLLGRNYAYFTNHNGSMENEFTPTRRLLLDCNTWQIKEEVIPPEQGKMMATTTYVGGRKSPRPA